jgi:hypothetical protein
MTVLTHTLRDLVRRRLWPVALLLVAALVAVPVVLAKPATHAPASPATTSAAPVATPADSYVELASNDTTTTTRRRVLGAHKDPFEPAPLPKVKHRKHAKKASVAKAAATATPTAAPASSGGTSVSTSTGSTGVTGGSVPSVPVVAVPTATPAPVKHFPANSVVVRFGKTGEKKTVSTLTSLETLPSSSSPLLVFMGFHNGGKVAEFMLTGDVTAEGDGTCTPSEKDCETLLLRRDQTEFLTFSGTGADGEYELDLNSLHPSKTASAAALEAKPAPTATAAPAVTATPTP